MENQNPINQLENHLSSMNLGGFNHPNLFSVANLLGERKTLDESSSSLPMIVNEFGSSTQYHHCWNSSLPHERSFLPHSNQSLRYKSVTEYTNGREILDDMLHKINYGRRFCGIFSSMETILNDPSLLDSDDPSFLYELREADIVNLAKNFKGFQYLKRILVRYGDIVMRKIFKAIVSSCNIIDFITNEFGKHIFKKLLGMCNPNQIEELVLRLTTQEDALFWISINKYGTSCVQKLIQMVRKSYLIGHIKEALTPRLFDMMIDQNGHHVIRTCLELLDRRDNDNIFEVAKRSCLNLAVHSQGFRTLYACIDHMTENHKRKLLEIIIENSVFLAQDTNGNYVVRHVLRTQKLGVNWRICHKLQDFYVRLSMLKSGSLVVDACAKSGGIGSVVNALVQSDKIVEVAQNKFGKYVVQTVLKATKGLYFDLYLGLEFALRPHLAELQYHPNGRHVYNLINEREY